MPRLYINSREIDFFNDISKEVIKDIVGTKIYYFQISLEKSNTHKIYEESTQKYFEEPIELECIVDWQSPEITTNKFGQESTSAIIVHIQSRDLIQKQVDVNMGSIFTYGEEVYEITKVRNLRNIYGQVERDDGIEVTGIRTKKDVVSIPLIGPTREDFDDPDAVQEEFKQQRGMVEADERDVVDEGRIDRPDITKPSKVNKSGFVGEFDE